MVFYHKGLRVRKTPLPFVACARKAAILRVQIWSAHESDVVGLCLSLTPLGRTCTDRAPDGVMRQNPGLRLMRAGKSSPLSETGSIGQSSSPARARPIGPCGA